MSQCGETAKEAQGDVKVPPTAFVTPETRGRDRNQIEDAPLESKPRKVAA
jgi:hypothetical protein